MILNIEKTKKQLESGGQYIPEYKDAKDLHKWMKEQREARRVLREGAPQ